jgi:hypothetical protein
LSLLQLPASAQYSSAAQTGHTQSLSSQVALQPKQAQAIGSGLVQKEAKAPMHVAGCEPPSPLVGPPPFVCPPPSLGPAPTPGAPPLRGPAPTPGAPPTPGAAPAPPVPGPPSPTELQLHASYAVPSALQTCTLLSPLGQAHACCAPGTQRSPAESQLARATKAKKQCHDTRRERRASLAEYVMREDCFAGGGGQMWEIALMRSISTTDRPSCLEIEKRPLDCARRGVALTQVGRLPTVTATNDRGPARRLRGRTAGTRRARRDRTRSLRSRRLPPGRPRGHRGRYPVAAWRCTRGPPSRRPRSCNSN